ncbi:hypothetical protein [Nakamurella deserti]|uniref:hypothetical protein n=1 Tax=Nakamurella deserti TaxID=2164074 RepID=UPI0013005CDE|nr:hypothetical protein [Nakamurella deserti]
MWGPVRRAVQAVLWVAVSGYAGWWAVPGTLLAVLLLDSVGHGDEPGPVLSAVGAAAAVGAVVLAGTVVNAGLRRLVPDLSRRRFVWGSVLSFAVPHLYFLAVVAGLPLPWRTPFG